MSGSNPVLPDPAAPKPKPEPTPITETQARLLCLLQRFGRSAVRKRWRQCCGELNADLLQLTEAELSAAVAQLSNPRDEPLPWQALREQMQRQRVTACVAGQLPQRLREIPDPPLALYLRGSPALLAREAVAIVGARRCSANGARIALDLAHGLAEQGFVVVSGLALGIDGQAHRGALQAGQQLGPQGAGATIAVLGGGLSQISPRSHAGLAARISENGGCVISEYSLTEQSYASHFPERNRLISGLVRAVIVIEAGLRSGSLITARLALEQGREVLAVPGSVLNPVSAGCHRLLQQGAALVTCVPDVLDALGCESVPQASSAQPASAIEAQVYAAVGRGAGAGVPVHVEQVQQLTQLPLDQVLQSLTRLELAGFVQRLPQGYIPSPR